MPLNITAPVKALRSGVLISAAIAIMIGNAAPKPRPASTRNTNSAMKFGAAIMPSVKRPKAATAPISTGLRPRKSASRPPMMAPRTMPTLLKVVSSVR